MLDCISGGRLVAGFPVGTSMDTNYCYGTDPGADAREIRRGARADHQGLDEARTVRLQRPLQQAAPRQHLAAADPAAASADPHPRRRLGRDLRLLHRQHLFLFLPQLLRLHPRPGADGGLLGPRGASAARRTPRPTAPASPRPSASPRPTRRPSGSTPSTCTTSTTAACTSIRASPTRRAIARSRRIQTGALSQYARARRLRRADLEGPDRGRPRRSPAGRRPCASGWRS